MDLPQSYKERVAELTDWRDAAKSPMLKQAYQRALDLTATAAETFIRLQRAAEVESAAYDEHANEVVESIEERAEELSQKAADVEARLEQEPLGADRTLAIEKDFVLIEIITQQWRAIDFQIMDMLRQVRVAAVPKLEKALFKDILEPDESAFSKEVAIHAIEFAIGLVPGVGQLYDVYTRARELFKVKQYKAGITSQHIEYLEGYCEALGLWCVAAEATIKRL